MISFEKVLAEEKPGLVVVGDVNSTLACALVATKLGVKLAHVGYRPSRSQAMAMLKEIMSEPEEITRACGSEYRLPRVTLHVCP
jgi:UDP-N-acetylglucosamine 2-epimerase